MNAIRTSLASLTIAVLTLGAVAAPAFAEAPAPTTSTARAGESAPQPEAEFGQWPVTSTAQITHPEHGTLEARTYRDAATGRSAFAAFGKDGIVYGYEFGATLGFTFAKPAQDATGNVFITYDAGRYPGLAILRPDGRWFSVVAHDYDNLSAGLDFHDAVLVGPGADGRVTIEKRTKGAAPTTTWRWNGATYVSDKASAKPAPKQAAKPKAKQGAEPAPEPSVAPTATPIAAPQATPEAAPVKTEGAAGLPILPIAAGTLLTAGSGGFLVGRLRRR